MTTHFHFDFRQKTSWKVLKSNPILKESNLGKKSTLISSKLLKQKYFMFMYYLQNYKLYTKIKLKAKYQESCMKLKKKQLASFNSNWNNFAVRDDSPRVNIARQISSIKISERSYCYFNSLVSVKQQSFSQDSPVKCSPSGTMKIFKSITLGFWKQNYSVHIFFLTFFETRNNYGVFNSTECILN